MRYLNSSRGGAPLVSLFGMSLSGALSDGAWKVLNHLAELKDPTTVSSLSHLPARQQWVDRQGRSIMRTLLDAVAKPIASCRATAPTVLHMDHVVEEVEAGPIGVSQIPRWSPRTGTSCTNCLGIYGHNPQCTSRLIIQWMRCLALQYLILLPFLTTEPGHSQIIQVTV